MAKLGELALNYKAGKDITDLDSIPVDIEVKEGEFDKNGQKMKYSYFEIDNWKYTLKSNVMSKIKQIMAARPTTKHIKVSKDDKGEYFVIPLD